MESVAYGLFPNRAAADAALARLERRGFPPDVVSVSEHEGELPDEDIPGPATRSRPNALIGGVVAALLGGVLGGLLIGGRFGFSPVLTGLVAAICAGVFGALLGTITGWAVPRREIEELEDDVKQGRVLVTIDSQTEHTSEELVSELEGCGAIRTGLLSGIGLGSTEAGPARGTSS